MPKKEIKIVTILGARPQFIKAATVSRAIKMHNIKKQSPDINEIIVHTGQHYDLNMSQVFFDQLEIPNPRYHLVYKKKTLTGSLFMVIPIQLWPALSQQ